MSLPEYLGTLNETLPGMEIFETGIELESNGYRIGFPKDSHCDHEREDGLFYSSFEENHLFSGMKCCHMELFQSMHGSIMEMKADDSFNVIDRRFVATVSFYRYLSGFVPSIVI